MVNTKIITVKKSKRLLLSLVKGFASNTIHGVITDGISSVDIGIRVVKFKQDDWEVGGKCD